MKFLDATGITYLWSRISGAFQAKVTASGILKGDGSGGVTAAVAGTDYKADSDVFIVNVSGSPLSGDKTHAEILAAYNAGKIVIAKHDYKSPYYLVRVGSSSANHTFAAKYSNEYYTLSCYTNNTWGGGQGTFQDEITASGILKGNGSGGVTAAVAGTDYAKPICKLYTGTCSDLPAETAKTVTLDDGAGFALEDGVKILVRFVNGNKASATLNVNSTGAVAMKRRNIDTLTLYSGASATGIASGESVLLTYYAGVTPAWMLSSGTASALLYLNRNGRVNDADASYTTYMARGEALNSSDTNPTANGCISWTYE